MACTASTSARTASSISPSATPACKDLSADERQGPNGPATQTDCRAGTIWRCDMDGKNLELIAHNFRNQYEPASTASARSGSPTTTTTATSKRASATSCPAATTATIPAARARATGTRNNRASSTRSCAPASARPTGICFYEGKLLPENISGQLLHCDAGPRECCAVPHQAEGRRLRTRKEDMVHQHRQLVPASGRVRRPRRQPVRGRLVRPRRRRPRHGRHYARADLSDCATGQ